MNLAGGWQAHRWVFVDRHENFRPPDRASGRLHHNSASVWFFFAPPGTKSCSRELPAAAGLGASHESARRSEILRLLTLLTTTWKRSISVRVFALRWALLHVERLYFGYLKVYHLMQPSFAHAP